MIEVDLGCEVVGGVESVNGKEGVVVLDGTEIELIENGGVTVTGAISDLDANKVTSVLGDGVDNADPNNPIMSFPTPTQIGLGNVDNTSDANKPVSTSTQTALDLKEEVFTDETKNASFTPQNDDNKNFFCDVSLADMVVTINTDALSVGGKMSFVQMGNFELSFVNGSGTLIGSPSTSFIAEGDSSQVMIESFSTGVFKLTGETL